MKMDCLGAKYVVACFSDFWCLLPNYDQELHCFYFASDFYGLKKVVKLISFLCVRNAHGTSACVIKSL